jgi:hypothetical protein
MAALAATWRGSSPRQRTAAPSPVKTLRLPASHLWRNCDELRKATERIELTSVIPDTSSGGSSVHTDPSMGASEKRRRNEPRAAEGCRDTKTRTPRFRGCPSASSICRVPRYSVESRSLVEPHCRVRRRLGIAHTLQNIPRALGQRLRRFFERHAPVEHGLGTQQNHAQ